MKCGAELDRKGKVIGHQPPNNEASNSPISSGGVHMKTISVSRLKTRSKLAKNGLLVGSIGLIVALLSGSIGLVPITIIGGLMAFYGFLLAFEFLFTGRSDARPGEYVKSYHCPHCSREIERGSLPDTGESMICPHCGRTFRT